MTIPRPAPAFTNPFADPTFIARFNAADARRTRLQRAITRDVDYIIANSSASDRPRSPTAVPLLPHLAPLIPAYRVLVRCLTLAAECLTDWHADALWRSFRRMVRRVERGENRFIALRDHVGTAIETTLLHEIAHALPTIWHALTAAIHDLVHRHWPTLVTAAARCSAENRWADPYLVLRNMRRLRQLAIPPVITTAAAV
jgi:hypothetical protein